MGQDGTGKAPIPAQEKHGPWTPQFLSWGTPASLGLFLSKNTALLPTQAGNTCSRTSQCKANFQMAQSKMRFSIHRKEGKRKRPVSSGAQTTPWVAAFFLTRQPARRPWAHLVPREAGRESSAGSWFPE